MQDQSSFVDGREKEAGLPISEYWINYNKNKQAMNRAFECVLYTDAHITGHLQEDECGPFKFLNTVPGNIKPGNIVPSIVLRCFFEAVPYDLQQASWTCESNLYHGGNLLDEIACLTSLFLGARIKPSGVTREFKNLEKDSYGHPISLDYRVPPTLSFRKQRLVLPCAIGTRNLNILLKDMKDILLLNTKEMVALIRSARMYQDALWIGESEPDLAWLMLVAALESIAGIYRGGHASDLDAFCESFPRIVDLIKESKSPELIEPLADEFASITKSTQKFLDFCLAYLPSAPASRPHIGLQIEWHTDKWREILRKIYNYRSKALHSGIPFPPLMTEPPPSYGSEDGIPAEIACLGLMMSTGQSSWKAEDLPINLNLFASVTREILLRWLLETAKIRA